jgi:hypothetical protein
MNHILMHSFCRRPSVALHAVEVHNDCRPFDAHSESLFYARSSEPYVLAEILRMPEVTMHAETRLLIEFLMG